jgi:hypothetical protein
MDTNKAAYWIALGVLVLGLNSEYRQGKFVALHRVAGRADSMICQIATRAEQTLAVARALTTREESPADNLLASTDGDELAREREELSRVRARDAAELVRDRVRTQIRDQVRDQIRAQVDGIRAQVEMRRAEIEQVRSRTRSEYRFTSAVHRRLTVACPKTGARVVVNDDPGMTDASEDAEDTF